MPEVKMNDVELTDEELGKIQGGGANYYTQDGKYYKYTGTDTNLKYTCPRCGGPVHKGTAWRYYCDPCDESWFLEAELGRNLESGAWTQISKEQFKKETWTPLI